MLPSDKVCVVTEIWEHQQKARCLFARTCEKKDHWGGVGLRGDGGFVWQSCSVGK